MGYRGRIAAERVATQRSTHPAQFRLDPSKVAALEGVQQATLAAVEIPCSGLDTIVANCHERKYAPLSSLWTQASRYPFARTGWGGRSGFRRMNGSPPGQHRPIQMPPRPDQSVPRNASSAFRSATDNASNAWRIVSASPSCLRIAWSIVSADPSWR